MMAFIPHHEQVIVTAVITVNTCKTPVQITAVNEACQDLLFHRTAEMATGLEFLIMEGDTLVQGTRPGMAGPVETADGGAGVRASGHAVASLVACIESISGSIRLEHT